MDPDVRFAVAKRIVERAEDHGIPRSDVDRGPAGDAHRRHGQARAGRCSGSSAGCATSWKVNTTCGASNVSFGLPNRVGINGAFLSMAIASGLTIGHHQPDGAEGVARRVMAATCSRATTRRRPLDPRFRDPAAEGEAGGRRVNARRRTGLGRA